MIQTAPPLVIYLNHFLKKQAFRATMTAIFFTDSIWRNFLYYQSGLVTLSTLQFALFLLPALVIGTLARSSIHHRINEKIFRKFVNTLLFFIGTALLFN
ncbi:TSUP family transporter [Candidatus Woesearchaeota archaeon]|nr:TSUP family transporter [Candidatus Woesearchaeota archaeon]